VYCSGLRIVYFLRNWDDYTTMVLIQEKSLRDCIYDYWRKFSKHLESAQEAINYQNTWTAYLTATFPDKIWYRSMGFRKNSVFPNRLAVRAQHSRVDWLKFQDVQSNQYEYFKTSSDLVSMFMYKHFFFPP